MNTFTPSKYQAAIYNFVKTGSGNAIVEAVAGSGKTSTLVDAARLTTGPAIFLAFNKSIAEELKPRCPANMQARTFHSLCYRPVLQVVGAKAVNDQKIPELIKTSMTEQQAKMYGSFVRRLIGFARNAGVGALSDANGQALYNLVEQHDLTLDSEFADEAEAVQLALSVLDKSNRSKEVDFDDLLYFSVLKGVKLPAFDWVFVDEAQDTNAIQRAILRKILAKRGRLIAVGDAAQAIYGFRGADSNALGALAEAFNPCVRLPLSVTYRCPTSVVERAQGFVETIEAAPGAQVGAVNELGLQWDMKALGNHDLVVCRNTKPLIELGFKLMKAKIPLRILGRDLGEGLLSLIRKCDTGRGNVDRFIERLETWRDREVEKAVAKGLDAKADAISDKAGTLLMLLEDLPENQRTVAALMNTIQALFTDANSRVTLATVHKAKGLEADTVWWLAPSLCPSRFAKQAWQVQQEHNLMYVAITRAKQTLNLIELPQRGGK